MGVCVYVLEEASDTSLGKWGGCVLERERTGNGVGVGVWWGVCVCVCLGRGPDSCLDSTDTEYHGQNLCLDLPSGWQFVKTRLVLSHAQAKTLRPRTAAGGLLARQPSETSEICLQKHKGLVFI